ncbi:MAG: DUF3667 domain-containing protein [Flavobacteriaceae bacterium]|nr:DUF3667 domain-containing protein [Flavobacteriaceae bacterium]
MSDSNTYCHNCDTPVRGKYCSACGQRTSVHKVTFKETFQDFWDFVFSVNAPLFNTLRLLVKDPGKLLREYLEGKRKRYYKPVAFFILMTVIYLVTRAVINYDPFGNTTIQVDDNTQSQLLTQARNFMLLNIDKLLFVFVFTMGLLLKLFFYKKRSLAEFIAISFYLIGIYTVLTTLNMFYIHYVNPNFQFLAMLAMLVYFCYALVSFFQKGKIIVLIKSLFIFVVGFISYGMIGFAISFCIIYLKQM